MPPSRRRALPGIVEQAARLHRPGQTVAGSQIDAGGGRVAENHPFTLRMTKLQINKAQDAQGFRSLLEDSLGDYLAMMFMPGFSTILDDTKRLRAVDLVVRGRPGERYGQDRTQRQT